MCECYCVWCVRVSSHEGVRQVSLFQWKEFTAAPFCNSGLSLYKTQQEAYGHTHRCTVTQKKLPYCTHAEYFSTPLTHPYVVCSPSLYDNPCHYSGSCNFLTILLCVSVWPTELPGLPTRLTPRKPEKQRPGWGFPPLLLQAPKQGPHLSLQCHQPQRWHQVPGAQCTGQNEQGWIIILTYVLVSVTATYHINSHLHIVYLSFFLLSCLSLLPLSIPSDSPLPEDRWQIWHHQLQSCLSGRWPGSPRDAPCQRPTAWPASPSHLSRLQTGAHFEWSAGCIWVSSTR